MAEVYCVHFLRSDMRSSQGNEKPWKVGERREIDGEIALCERGYHYSPNFGAALLGGWLYGPMACIVRVDDSGPKDETKGVSPRRELVEVYDVGAALVQFAFEEADRAVRVSAPKALRAAGLKVEAKKLESLPRIVDAKTAYSASSAADSASYASYSVRNAADSASYAANSALNAAYSARYAAASASYAANSISFAANSISFAANSAYRKRQAKRFAALMAEVTGWIKA